MMEINITSLQLLYELSIISVICRTMILNILISNIHYKEGNKMENSTTVDTIGLRIDLNSVIEQRAIQSDLLNFMAQSKSVYISYKDYYYGLGESEFNREYFINSLRTTIATIYTGFFSTINHMSKLLEKRYYINIKFAGLKRYNKLVDDASYDFLLRVCAYLNTRKIAFDLTELDVCIDMQCQFKNVLSVCIQKSPKTKYYGLNEIQPFRTTSYLEMIEKEKLDRAVLRAYTYDKAYKEKLPYPLTRFEVKLQPKYFNKHGFDIESIEKVLNRYCVMYFEDIETKYKKIKKYTSYKKPKGREIKRLGFENYRIYPDIDYIEEFIELLQNIDEFRYEFGLY